MANLRVILIQVERLSTWVEGSYSTTKNHRNGEMLQFEGSDDEENEPFLYREMFATAPSMVARLHFSDDNLRKVESVFYLGCLHPSSPKTLSQLRP